MHPKRPPERLLPEAWEAAHRRLVTLLVEIEAGDAHALSALRTDLPRHFAEEEKEDGLFDWLVVLRPDAGAAVRALEAEHEALLTELAGLVPGVTARGFVGRLRDHEAREAELLGMNRQEPPPPTQA